MILNSEWAICTYETLKVAWNTSREVEEIGTFQEAREDLNLRDILVINNNPTNCMQKKDAMVGVVIL